MRRLLTISLIALALVVGAAGRAPAAHAQGESYQTAQYTTAVTTSAANAAAVNNGKTTSPASTAAAGTPTNPSLSGDTASQFGTIMAWIMSLFAWLVGVAAITLDNVVYYTVITMGSYVHNLAAVGVTWRILRDLANIMLIFGFIGAGIATILNVEQYGWSTKMLPMLLVAAVFLNFSLFISEAMIDATNLFATQFYNEINGGNPVQPTGYSINLGVVSFGNNQVSKEPISNAIMGSLGLQTLYNVNNTNPNVLKGNHTWLIGWLGILLFLVTAFVMFSLAFILVARFVALIFLILLSPVGFMGLAIPQLKYRAGQWWSNFLEQIITAPVLLLLLYVALAVITDAKFLTGFNSSSAGWLALDSNNITGFAGILLSFLVAIGLLLVVVIKAKSMGAVGADWATKTAGKLTFGATALVGRTTVGWGGKKLANLSRRVGLARVPLVGTGITRGLDRVASGSFDVRGIAVGGGLAAVGAGTAQKGGYKADLKSRIESRTKYASELTGRELNDDEKIQLAIHQKVLAADEKQLSEKRAKQMRNKRDGVVDADLDRDIRKLEEDTKEGKKEVEKIENLTDKGAQRKYASWLELGQKPKGVFNTYFNFAANTEAAKAIRATAKKAKPDKDFTTNMKNLLKEAAKESGEETETGPTTPPAATPTTSAPATPPSGPTTAPGGGTPPAP